MVPALDVEGAFHDVCNAYVNAMGEYRCLTSNLMVVQIPLVVKEEMVQKPIPTLKGAIVQVPLTYKRLYPKTDVGLH